MVKGRIIFAFFMAWKLFKVALYTIFDDAVRKKENLEACTSGTGWFKLANGMGTASFENFVQDPWHQVTVRHNLTALWNSLIL